MKIHKLIWLAVLAWIIAPVIAQVVTNAPPPPDTGPVLPLGKDAIWLALIPPITFTITWLVGKIPPLPKVILPWITPLIGIGVGAVMEWATKANLPWWSSAGAGAIATTIYQAAKGITKAGPESALTPTPGPNDPPENQLSVPNSRP